MNGIFDINEETNIQEINMNQALLLKEKLNNIQNIHLRKNLKFQKEAFEKIKKEKQLNFQNESLKIKNIELSQNIKMYKEEIQNLINRNLSIKQQSEEINTRISDQENLKTKLTEEVKDNKFINTSINLKRNFSLIYKIPK